MKNLTFTAKTWISVLVAMLSIASARPALAAISQADIGKAAFVGAFRDGPINTPVQVSSFGEFQSEFGASGSIAWYEIQLYFQNGGQSAWVVRAEIDTDTSAAMESLRSVADSFGQLVIPGLSFLSDPERTQAVDRALSFAQELQLFLILDPLPEWNDDFTSQHPERIRFPGLDSMGEKTQYGAVYFPSLIVWDGDRALKVGPAGAVAGIIATADSEVGPWKAPAGPSFPLQGINGIQLSVSDEQNGILRAHGVNGIRSLLSQGVLVYGASTLMTGTSSPDPGLRFIHTIREKEMIRKSIETGLSWTAFEENDARLWAAIRSDVSTFMNSLWAQGGLFGDTSSSAYQVMCDSVTTSIQDIMEGKVRLIVNWAPERPAEFISTELTLNARVP